MGRVYSLHGLGWVSVPPDTLRCSEPELMHFGLFGPFSLSALRLYRLQRGESGGQGRIQGGKGAQVHENTFPPSSSSHIKRWDLMWGMAMLNRPRSFCPRGRCRHLEGRQEIVTPPSHFVTMLPLNYCGGRVAAII